jgi:hypothetical protein
VTPHAPREESAKGIGVGDSERAADDGTGPLEVVAFPTVLIDLVLAEHDHALKGAQ